MYVLITYDVSTSDDGGQKRLRKVARLCERYGQRVQCSVFECLVNPSQLLELKRSLLEICDLSTDSIRIYNLGDRWLQRVEHYGAKAAYNPEGPLIV